MPRKPLFESERAREWVIAAAMIALLGCSLGLAFLVTKRQPLGTGALTLAARRQTVGTLAISIPEGWVRVSVPAKARGLESAQVFGPSSAGPHLLVGQLHFPAPQSPLDALTIPVISLLPSSKASLHRQLQAVRAKTMVGQVVLSIEGTPQSATENFLAVLTENGRDYWVIHLQIGQATADSDESLAERYVFFQEILASTEDSAFRDATAGDFARVNLPTGDPTLATIEGLGPRSAGSPRVDEPVTLVPDDALDDLRYFRVRAVPDAGIDEAGHPLGPESMLRLQFLHTMNRPASAQEVARQQVAGRPAWGVTFTTAPAGRGRSNDLIRQLWYTRTSPGQALLIEIVTEPGGLPSCQALLPRIVEALTAPNAGPSTTQATPAFETVERRGLAISQAIRLASARGHDPGWSFFRIDMGEHPIGYRIDQRLPPVTGKPMTVAGNHSMVIYNELAMSSRWEMSEDGRRFRWRQEIQTREGEPGSPEHVIQQELTLEDRRLLMRDAGVGGKEVWTATLPDSYLGPMLDDAWIAEGASGDSAIIWMSPDGDPPMPFVLTASPPSSNGELHVGRRALTALDADELVFDSSGRLLRSDIYVRAAPAGEAVRTLRRVDRSELIATFPQLKNELDRTGAALPRE